MAMPGYVLMLCDNFEFKQKNNNNNWHGRHNNKKCQAEGKDKSQMKKIHTRHNYYNNKQKNLHSKSIVARSFQLKSLKRLNDDHKSHCRSDIFMMMKLCLRCCCCCCSKRAWFRFGKFCSAKIRFPIQWRRSKAPCVWMDFQLKMTLFGRNSILPGRKTKIQKKRW